MRTVSRRLAPLSLLLLAACQSAPPSGPSVLTLDLPPAATQPAATDFNVRSYGATGDGKTIDSHAINKAIDAAASVGGGRVFLPAGTYLSGSIRLQSNIELHLAPGARILGLPAENPAYDMPEYDLRPQPHYQDHGHTYFRNSLIWGENLRNVSITGMGMIDGGGMMAFDPRTGSPGANKALALLRCSQVTVRDVTFFHGGHFAILVTACDLLTLDNLTIDTNRDGIDIDCCRNTTVSNCRINAPRDDALCPKSSYGAGELLLTENLTITNCQVSGFLEGTLLDGTMKPSTLRNGRIKFGTESTGGFRNVTISNCTFRHSRGLALESVDGGILENFNISNLTMTDVAHYPIYLTTGTRNRGPNPGTSRMRNISIANVSCIGVDAPSGIQITGIPGAPIENVRLQDIHILSKGTGTREEADLVPYELATGYPEPARLGIMPAYGLYARHVKNLELANIRLGFEEKDLRHAIALSDVDNVEIDNLKAQTAEGAAAPARFEAVKNITLRNSPTLEKPGAILASDTARKGDPAPNNRRPTMNAMDDRPAPPTTRPASRPARDNYNARPDLPWLK